jgi:predicted RNA-binding Zn ribbon-like protein
MMEFTRGYFIGGLYCLDFCNTVDHRHQPPEYDLLPDGKTVLDWGRASGTPGLGGRTAPSSSAAPMARVRKVRDRIYGVLAPLAHAKTPTKAALSAFNELLREASGKSELTRNGGAFQLACPAEDPVENILCHAVRSAAELLLANETDRIRECSGCGWLFYDVTRNRSRRWCNMAVCGNRAKARRHYRKVRRKQ